MLTGVKKFLVKELLGDTALGGGGLETTSEMTEKTNCMVDEAVELWADERAKTADASVALHILREKCQPENWSQ